MVTIMEQWQPIAVTATVTCPMLQAKYGIDTDRFFVMGVRYGLASIVTKPLKSKNLIFQSWLLTLTL